MKTRPILFSAPMVRAILEGRKTQTRRVVKYFEPVDDFSEHIYPGEFVPWRCGEPQHSIHCPYGVPGERLWVRETFSYSTAWPKVAKWGSVNVFSDPALWYWADGNPPSGDWSKAKPSIHMPRWASRITLQIIDVRAERLRSISNADAEAEGPPKLTTKLSVYPGTGAAKVERELDAVSCFAHLWDDINGEGSWNSNPWVWIIEFARVSEPT